MTEGELAAVLARQGSSANIVHADEPPKPNKYGARRTPYNGRMYDSKAEATYAARLDLMVKAGEISGWSPQVTVRVVLLPTGIEWGLYQKGLSGRRGHRLVGTELLRCRLDFYVHRKNGSSYFVEVKGFRVRDWALREHILRLSGVPLEVVR